MKKPMIIFMVILLMAGLSYGQDAVVADLQWNGLAGTNWNTAGNWTPNGIPTASVNVTIPAGPANMPVVDEFPRRPATCRNLTINAGASLTINAGRALTVAGVLSNLAGTSGLILRSDAKGTGSLIDNGSIKVPAMVERYLAPDAWHYISSPVRNGTATTFIGDYLKTSDPSAVTGWGGWIVDPGTALQVMRGYACWKPSTNGGLETFTGILNTGPENFAGIRNLSDPWNGWHLAGNPYPSAINLSSAGVTWDYFEPAAYFWNQSGTNSPNPEGGNYEVYTVFSAFGTHSPIASATQGFYVHIVKTHIGSSILTVTNAARVHSGETFLKDLPVITNGLLLTVSSCDNHYSDKITVQFNPRATAFFDPGYDAYKLEGLHEAPQLYTKIADTNVSCNSLPFTNKNMVIPVTFTSGPEGQYLLEADSMMTFAQNIAITLEDLETGTTQDLRSSDTYLFTSDTLDNPNRFVLHFYNPSFGIPEINPGQPVQIYSYGNAVYIKSKDGNLQEGNVIVYDLPGKELFRGTLSAQVLNRFTTNVAEGYYLVRVKTASGTCNGKVYLR